MESVIYQASPLAEFLQVSEEADNEWSSAVKPATTPTQDDETFSFAPRGISQAIPVRKRPVSQIVFTESLFSRLRQRCTDTFTWRIGQSDQIQALEQLRYTIIGSQLLNDRPAGQGSNARLSSVPAASEEIPIEYTTSGLLYTAGAAFACALSLWWASQKRTRLTIVSAILVAACLMVYTFCVKQYRRYARNYAVRTVIAMVGNAQAFDSATYTASSFIQEVELVARGYRLSNPLPPATRLDDGTLQNRRCRRLRHALRSALDDLFTSHVNAYKRLHVFANGANLERYFDMYEISRFDIEDILSSKDTQAGEDSETLRTLKVDLHRLLISRRMFLCSILALDTDRKSSLLDWSMVTEIMENITNRTAAAAITLDGILNEEQDSESPPSPKLPQTPDRERLRHHTRRIASLSQGLRGIQAKMHILREELDQSVASPEDFTQLGTYRLEQYDAIGNDMKLFLAEWEESRQALINVETPERRISSLIINTPLSDHVSRSSSPNNSLGGVTAVSGSPSEALRILNGETLSSQGELISSEEEIFEALASPRAGNRLSSHLSRDERISRMREERLRSSILKESREARGNMVKELETVIRARPRKRNTSSPMRPVPVKVRPSSTSTTRSSVTTASPPLPGSPKSPTGWGFMGVDRFKAREGIVE